MMMVGREVTMGTERGLGASQNVFLPKLAANQGRLRHASWNEINHNLKTDLDVFVEMYCN